MQARVPALEMVVELLKFVSFFRISILKIGTALGFYGLSVSPFSLLLPRHFPKMNIYELCNSQREAAI